MCFRYFRSREERALEFKNMKRKPVQTEIKSSRGTSNENFEKTYKKRIQTLKQGIQEILIKKELSMEANRRLLEELNMVIQGYNYLKDKDGRCDCLAWNAEGGST